MNNFIKELKQHYKYFNDMSPKQEAVLKVLIESNYIEKAEVIKELEELKDNIFYDKRSFDCWTTVLTKLDDLISKLKENDGEASK